MTSLYTDNIFPNGLQLALELAGVYSLRFAITVIVVARLK